jgi:hypothetical protein
MLLCRFITGLKHVDRACASEILQSKYIASLFTKRMKDVILELYMLLCFCCAVDSILHNDPYRRFLYQIHNPPEMNTTPLTKTELATT